MINSSEKENVSSLDKGAQSHKDEKRLERFFVGEEMHYGYYLLPENVIGRKSTPDDLIFPEFMTKQAETAFEVFFQRK
jgi:hypothetical protein